MREVKSLDDSAQSGVLNDMLEKFGKDKRVRYCDLTIQSSKCSCMKGPGSQEARYQVDITGRIPIGWNISSQLGDDLI